MPYKIQTTTRVVYKPRVDIDPKVAEEVGEIFRNCNLSTDDKIKFFCIFVGGGIGGAIASPGGPITATAGIALGVLAGWQVGDFICDVKRECSKEKKGKVKEHKKQKSDSKVKNDIPINMAQVKA